VSRDPELQAFLSTPFPNDLDDVPSTRRAQSARAREAGAAPELVGVRWKDKEIEGPDATTLIVRVYEGDETSLVRGALLFFHGGAFVFGDLESEHARCAMLARESNCVVVSVGYRLAPEHPYPAAVNDGVAALGWLFENAASLFVDTARVGIGGASAGAAIATVVALRWRDEGGLALRAQLLVYPVTDDAAKTGSMEQYWHSEPWDGERSTKMWPIYLGGAPPSTYVSPARVEDLSGLPRTYLMVAEEDPLRDQALDFAGRLVAAGVSVDLRLFAETFHGFDVVAPNARLSVLALTEQHAFVQRELGSTTSSN
jgi:acetyl esterase